MIHFIVFLLVLGFMVEVGRRIFINSARDTGIVRCRGYVFLAFLFSFFIFLLGQFGVHRESEAWGYLSLLLLFGFFVLTIMRSQSSASSKSKIRASLRENLSKNE